MVEWARPLPTWSYLILALAIVVVMAVARRMAISAQLKRWRLFVPRLAVFAILLWILCNPVRRQEQQLPSDPPSVVFLFDGSRSMALDAPTSRLDQAKQLAQSVDSVLPREHRPNVHFFRFGQQLAGVPALAQITALENDSQLQAALEQLPSRFTPEPPRAVVVFSDGAMDRPFNADAIATMYRNLNIPIHVVPLGNRSVRGDVAIQDLVVPRRVEPGVKAPVRAVLRSQGFQGERVVVQVRPANRPQDQPLVSVPLTLTDSTQNVDLVVEANPDLGELVLEVPELAGEAIAENNTVAFQLGAKNRKIKVIYMEGTAGDEYRWVRDALMEDKDIECVSMVADHQYVERPRLMRVGDPYKGFPTTREELLEYDCVICSDISRGAFTREQLDWTVELVAKRGGGFAMVGGITSFGAGGWDQTVWDQLIPVDMRGGTVGQGWVYHSFKMTVPPEVQSHPIWRLTEDPEKNRQALEKVPPFLGTNYILRLKPAATALSFSAVPIPSAGIMPLMACESYGRGRTFAFAPDTTVEWGRLFESQWGENDNRYFRKFWRNVVRWLTEHSIAGSRRLQVETDRLICRPGQKLVISARAYDEALRETVAYQVSATLLDDKGEVGPEGAQTVTLLPTADGKLYQGEMVVPAWRELDRTGSQRSATTCKLRVQALDKTNVIGENTLSLTILDDSDEFVELRPQPQNLRALANGTSGRIIENPPQLAEELQGLPVKKGEMIVSRTPTWDRPLYLFMILALLSTEWILRRRAGFG